MINTSTNKIEYKGDGTTTSFPITFPFIERGDIAVYIVEGSETTRLTKDYYVDTEGSSVTYPGYPPGEEPAESEQPAPLKAGAEIVIMRSIPITQERSMGSIWPFNEIEKAADKLTMIVQDIYEKLNRSVKLPVGTSFKGDFELPNPKAGNVIAWNDDGTNLVNQDVLTPARKLAEESKASAEAAAESRDAAKTSEDNVKEAQESLAKAIEDDKNEILQFSMDLMDQNESDLGKYVKKVEDLMDESLYNAQTELTSYVSAAKNYAETAKKAAGYDPNEHYTKTEVDQKITDALKSIDVYDGKAF